MKKVVGFLMFVMSSISLFADSDTSGGMWPTGFAGGYAIYENASYVEFKLSFNKTTVIKSSDKNLCNEIFGINGEFKVLKVDQGKFSIIPRADTFSFDTLCINKSTGVIATKVTSEICTNQAYYKKMLIRMTPKDEATKEGKANNYQTFVNNIK